MKHGLQPLAGLTRGGKIPPYPGDSKMGKHAFKRPRPPKSRAELESALDAHDRIQAISDAIRSREGRAPLPENGIVSGWRLALQSAPAPRKAKATTAKRQEPLTDEQLLAEIRRRRLAHEREGEALRAEALDLFRAGVAGATAVGRALGVKRQRVYQLAEAAS